MAEPAKPEKREALIMGMARRLIAIQRMQEIEEKARQLAEKSSKFVRPSAGEPTTDPTPPPPAER
jgi:hypothetical protein